MTKYVIYAIDQDGDGRVIQIAEFTDIYELLDYQIPIGHFADDVVISFEEVHA